MARRSAPRRRFPTYFHYLEALDRARQGISRAAEISDVRAFEADETRQLRATERGDTERTEADHTRLAKRLGFQHAEAAHQPFPYIRIERSYERLIGQRPVWFPLRRHFVAVAKNAGASDPDLGLVVWMSMRLVRGIENEREWGADVLRAVSLVREAEARVRLRIHPEVKERLYQLMLENWPPRSHDGQWVLENVLAHEIALAEALRRAAGPEAPPRWRPNRKHAREWLLRIEVWRDLHAAMRPLERPYDRSEALAANLLDDLQSRNPYRYRSLVGEHAFPGFSRKRRLLALARLAYPSFDGFLHHLNVLIKSTSSKNTRIRTVPTY